MNLLIRLYSRLNAALHGYRLGTKSKVWPGARIRRRHGGSITIGSRTSIHPGAMLLTYGGTIALGDRVSVNPYCVLYGHGGLKIGNDVHIAAHTVIVPGNHIFDDPTRPIGKQGDRCLGITIEDDVWIGAGVHILDGVIIARGCVIGAGAVVTKSTEPFGIYVGTPAKLKDSRLK